MYVSGIFHKKMGQAIRNILGISLLIFILIQTHSYGGSCTTMLISW